MPGAGQHGKAAFQITAQHTNQYPVVRGSRLNAARMQTISFFSPAPRVLALHLTLRVAFSDILSLVIGAFTTGQPQLDLGAAAPQMHLEGYYRVTGTF